MASKKMPEQSKSRYGEEIREAEAAPSDSSGCANKNSPSNDYTPGSDSGSVNDGSGEKRNVDSKDVGSANVQGPERGAQFASRVGALPLARWAAASYSRLREVPFVAVPLVLVECALGLSILPFQILAVPLSGMCPVTLRAADWALCRGLDVVEAVCHCITSSPGKIASDDRIQLVNCACFCPRALGRIARNVYQWQIQYLAHR